MGINFETLQSFLECEEIPIIKPPPKTFLGIAKQPHYENVLSNLLAFYLDVHEDHGMKDLFIASLLECINKSGLGAEKSALEGFRDFNIDTEYSTRKGRIDILLHNKEQAIIIENKVYHHLSNDLEDYWDSIHVEHQNNNKIGIILSLHPVYTEESHFINVTHIDFLDTVVNNLGPYMLNASSKYVTFLEDLYQNTKNLSKPTMKEEELKFYFNHRANIEQTVQFRSAVKDHIVAEVEKVGMSIVEGGLHIPRKGGGSMNRLRYFQSREDKNLMITVIFEDIMDKKQLCLNVELQGSALHSRGKYKSVDFSSEELELINKSGFYKNTNSEWAHFARTKYTVDEVEITDLSVFIIKKLNIDHLLSIFRKLEIFLKKDKT